jgi:hypothetical protein
MDKSYSMSGIRKIYLFCQLLDPPQTVQLPKEDLLLLPHHCNLAALHQLPLRDYAPGRLPTPSGEHGLHFGSADGNALLQKAYRNTWLDSKLTRCSRTVGQEKDSVTFAAVQGKAFGHTQLHQAKLLTVASRKRALPLAAFEGMRSGNGHVLTGIALTPQALLRYTNSAQSPFVEEDECLVDTNILT